MRTTPNQQTNYFLWVRPILFLLVLVLPIVGCGGNLGQVSGKVTYNEKPVTGGTVIFKPAVDGGPSSGEINSDGTFTLKTTNGDSGAIIGGHTVIYTPPEPEMTEEQRKDPSYTPKPSPYVNLSPKSPQVEVSAGTNEITIVLTRK